MWIKWLVVIIICSIYSLSVDSWTPLKSYRRPGLSSIRKDLSKYPVRLQMNIEDNSEDVTMEVINKEENSFNPITVLDPTTRGGLVFWGSVLTLGPLAFYSWYTSVNPDSVTGGAYVGSILVFLICIMWTSSYLFRVVNKDTTYAKQLRDYEGAVLRKRLGELNDEEIGAILEEIEQEKVKAKK